MSKRYHWWISAKDETGKPYLVYGAPDFGSAGGEDAARHKAFEMLGNLSFRLCRYPTSDLGTASAFHRGKRLDSGEGLRASSQRLGHERSVDRLRKRIAARQARGVR